MQALPRQGLQQLAGTTLGRGVCGHWPLGNMVWVGTNGRKAERAMMRRGWKPHPSCYTVDLGLSVDGLVGPSPARSSFPRPPGPVLARARCVHTLTSSAPCPSPVSPGIIWAESAPPCSGVLVHCPGNWPNPVGKSHSIFDSWLEPGICSPLDKLHFREEQESVMELEVPSGSSPCGHQGDRGSRGRGRRD